MRMAADAPLFRRDEVLAGMPARRAATILYAIERRTALAVHRSRTVLATYLTPGTAQEQEAAFLGALAAGRGGTTRPSAQDLERYAPEWADLVPDDPGTRAAMARLVGDAYRLTAERARRIRASLGLDEPVVVEAYQRLHGQPLESIWAPRLTLRERLAWWRARAAERIETLPPFWMAYALMLTETIGEGVLSVPIAVAAMGPAVGVVVLVILGLVNMLTLGAVVEAITRNGEMRYGTAYFGRLVGDLLGKPSSVALGLALAALNVVTLLTYYLAFGTVLEGATSVTAVLWVAVLFGVNLLYLHRESFDATVSTAVVVGAANIVLIVAICVISLGHLQPDALATVAIPGLNGQPFEVATLQLVLGVILLAYFGHTSAAAAAKVVLAADPGGRSLLWGNLAAMATVIGLYCLATVSIDGVLGTSLVGYAGTALTPLAEVVGPIIDVLGSLYVTLAIGFGSIYISLSLYNQAVEVVADRQTRRAPTPGTSGHDRRARRIAGFGAVGVVFLGVELMLITGTGSFVGPLGIVGTLTVPLLAGVFPMLLVWAARRTGERVPATVLRLLGSRVTVGVVVVLFLAAVLLHGLVIWQEPITQVAALAVFGGMVVLIVLLLRSDVFHPRTVIELVRSRQPRVPSDLRLVAQGVAIPVDGVGADPSGRFSVTVPASVPREAVVWAHTVSADGQSLGLRGTVSADGGPASELAQGRSRLTMPAGEVSLRLETALPEVAD
jgi:amino acid permease